MFLVGFLHVGTGMAGLVKCVMISRHGTELRPDICQLQATNACTVGPLHSSIHSCTGIARPGDMSDVTIVYQHVN